MKALHIAGAGTSLQRCFSSALAVVDAIDMSSGELSRQELQVPNLVLLSARDCNMNMGSREMMRTTSKARSAVRSTAKPGKIPEFYNIKSDGAVTLNLQKAAHSESFKEGIRRIRAYNLELTQQPKG